MINALLCCATVTDQGQFPIWEKEDLSEKYFQINSPQVNSLRSIIYIS